MRPRSVACLVAGVIIAWVYFANASWLAPQADGVPGVLAHRGVHQAFRREGLTNETCTARRIIPPTNNYLENSIASMRASFAAGATAIEVDVHPTTDGDFAVFHDWTLECRTNGRGVTRDQTMAYLQTLDIGHGYTADNGKTYPFRGKGAGMMPTLDEVLTTFKGRQVLINMKSRDPSESVHLAAYLKSHGHDTGSRLWVWAEGTAHERLRALEPKARIESRARAKSCAKRYLALGWSGHVPDACRGSSIYVPANLAFAYWGWPNRFLERMEHADVQVILVGPIGGPEPGISTPSELDVVPDGFGGLIMTDHIEVIGPRVRQLGPRKTKTEFPPYIF